MVDCPSCLACSNSPRYGNADFHYDDKRGYYVCSLCGLPDDGREQAIGNVDPLIAAAYRLGGLGAAREAGTSHPPEIIGAYRGSENTEGFHTLITEGVGACGMNLRQMSVHLLEV
jgi:hypothetical protein